MFVYYKSSSDFHGKDSAIFGYPQKSFEIFGKCLESFVRYQVENWRGNKFPYLHLHVLFSILMLNWSPNNKVCVIDSPAAKTGLLVDDEILEVNGERVNNLSHTEVILSIHKVSHFCTTLQ